MSQIRLAVTATKRTIVTLLVNISLFASSASAALINLNFNSLPSAQGWNYETSAGSNEEDVFSVDKAALHQNSLGIVDDPKYVWQGVVERAPFDLRFRARLTEFDGPFPDAFAFSVLLGAGDFFVYIGLGPGFIAIEENITTVQTVFIDTSRFHDYRLLGDPEAGSYRFFIDGVEVLSQVIGHIPLDSRFLMIGDRVFGGGPSIAPVGAKADLSFFSFDNVAVGGAVTGVSPNEGKVTCRNLTTKKTVRIEIPNGVRSWDCEQAGLVINSGDKIRMTVTVTGPAD